MDVMQSSLQGLQLAVDAVNRSADRIAKVSVSLGEGSGDVVDLSAEAVALMEARNAFTANIRVAETAQEMTKQTLDLLA